MTSIWRAAKTSASPWIDTHPQGAPRSCSILAEVGLIDSMGVRSLVLFARGTPCDVVLRYPQDSVMRIFELLQLDEVPGIRVVQD